MLLCATSNSSEHSFVVSPENKRTYRLERGQCETNQKFQDLRALEELKDSGFDVENSSFKFLQAGSKDGRQLIGSGLKRMCPSIFDPAGETRRDLCMTLNN